MRPALPVTDHRRLGTEPVDGLRGLAVLLVIAYHTWLFSWLDPSVSIGNVALPTARFVRPGYLGVDMFFLVSAFCLTYPYVRGRFAAIAAPTWRSFAYRRFIKIVPSYLIVLALSTAISLGTKQLSLPSLGETTVRHLLFVQNTSIDPLGRDNPVLWSLGVEVQFYCVFPLLLWVFLRWPVPFALAMVTVAMFYRTVNAACCVHEDWVMRELPAYFDIFALGMLAAYVVEYARTSDAPILQRRWLFTVLGALGAAGAFALLGSLDARTYEPDSREQFDLYLRPVFALTLAVFVAGSCLGYRWWRRIVGNRVLAAISVLSYNLYLWHALVALYLYHRRLPPTVFAEPHDDPAWRIPYVVFSWTLSFAIAAAITYFIERPLLATVKPQRFAFDWRRRSPLGMPGTPLAPVEPQSAEVLVR